MPDEPSYQTTDECNKRHGNTKWFVGLMVVILSTILGCTAWAIERAWVASDRAWAASERATQAAKNLEATKDTTEEYRRATRESLVRIETDMREMRGELFRLKTPKPGG